MATAHPISTAIGRSILEEGGNAYDAALAVSASLPVVLPQANGVGSDLFAVIRDQSIETLNASGPSAELATPERFEAAGRTAIPDHGPLASFMVPGLVAAWSFFAERATMPFPTLVAPAVHWARHGVPVTPLLATAIAGMPWADPDWQRTYRGHGAGKTLRQPDLARTLEGIALDGGHGFYHGPLAHRIEQDMLDKGGLLRFADLDRYEPTHPAPLRVRYRGYDVLTTPPNSQGATALYWLARLEHHALAAMTPSEYVATLSKRCTPRTNSAPATSATPIAYPFLPTGWRPQRSPHRTTRRGIFPSRAGTRLLFPSSTEPSA